MKNELRGKVQQLEASAEGKRGEIAQAVENEKQLIGRIRGLETVLEERDTVMDTMKARFEQLHGSATKANVSEGSRPTVCKGHRAEAKAEPVEKKTRGKA